MSDQDKVRENFLRRQAKRLGLGLNKSRGKKWNVNDQLGFRIIDPEKNIILLGEKLDLTIEDVSAFLDEYERKLRS